ncbi:MAG TPA: hypothetical protein VEM36_02080 [Xanthobacteraceae bacterium]|nr:hypothetical protein [Xanthobacteraceae bacterium]
MKMMRRAMLTCAMALLAGSASADERSAALVNSFRFFCTLELPDFSRLDANATKLKLPVRNDVGTPRQNGQFAHSKSWLVPLKSGPYELVASEARGPKGEVAACAIGAPDARGEDVKQDLIKAMGLGPPSREAITENGRWRETTWRERWGSDDVTLLLTDATPANAPGIYLTVLHELGPGQ